MEPTLVDFPEGSRFEDVLNGILTANEAVVKLVSLLGIWINAIGVICLVLLIIELSREIQAIKGTPGERKG